VVVGADPGSKYDKARTLGVTTLDEDQFDQLLAGKLAEPKPAAQPEGETVPKAKARSKKASAKH
jgi:BRCT domain type II-containing protein